ncbi:hypothetical protein GCM10020254_60320 [Streptomyces goshikiensis]
MAVAGIVVGIALLMTGVIWQSVLWISVVGFLVMLGCTVLVVTGWRKAPKPGEQPVSGSASGSGHGQNRQRRSMMTRIEERWQRRRDEHGQ